MYQVLIGFNVITKDGEVRFEAGDVVDAGDRQLPAEADLKSLLEMGAIKKINKDKQDKKKKGEGGSA